MDCLTPFLFYFEDTSQSMTDKRELGIKDLTCINLLNHSLIFSDDRIYKSVLVSFVIRTNHTDIILLYFHWILKLHL